MCGWILPVLIRSQEKNLHYTFILSKKLLSQRRTVVTDTMHIKSLFRQAKSISRFLFDLTDIPMNYEMSKIAYVQIWSNFCTTQDI